ncbi:MAG: hypothetical protein L0312_10610, partial [Acidobacteria bacterium]|nr:hypothetical protein [Acidobacteriota bacterium]
LIPFIAFYLLCFAYPHRAVLPEGKINDARPRAEPLFFEPSVPPSYKGELQGPVKVVSPPLRSGY